MIPKALTGVGTLGALGLVGAVGIAGTLPLIMMMNFACRNCGNRGRVPRDQYNGRCPSCNQPFKVRDVKRIKVAQSAPTTTGPDAQMKEDPLTVLKLRLAKGELTLDQYTQLAEIVK